MINLIFYVFLFVLALHLFYSLQIITGKSKLFKLIPTTLHGNEVIQTPISFTLKMYQLRAENSFNGIVFFNHVFIGVKDPSEFVFFTITSWRRLSYFSAYRSDNGLAIIIFNITFSLVFKMPNKFTDRILLQEKKSTENKD